MLNHVDNCFADKKHCLTMFDKSWAAWVKKRGSAILTHHYPPERVDVDATPPGWAQGDDSLLPGWHVPEPNR